MTTERHYKNACKACGTEPVEFETQVLLSGCAPLEYSTAELRELNARAYWCWLITQILEAPARAQAAAARR